ncbi:DUF115 domain-containing protein [Psychrobium sp. MM17-31]|uniref:motility associated factor glycosyltransferase family protein n=1 Tax=Psychrobium sp. MM17-31 TaxID=2917758 RepID=UPI001EF4B327|nr:6-hydroxymethylpterin diphosphokinase MptE-like protein [Psychrobium sp. MM17-31]MCG7530116.1 DUF115 domain-containing protein [Psychrobium sp. MM17-31]
MSSQQTVIDEPILSNEFGNQFLYSINGDTFANQSAKEHYNQLLSENFWKEDSYHVVAGTDSGLLIEHIVNEGIPKNSVYLFVECSEYIELIRPELNDEWQQVLKFCTAEEWEQGFDHETAAAYFYNEAVLLHYSSAIRAGRSELYHQLKLRLNFIYRNKVYENSAALGNREFIECQLKNAPFNFNSAQLLNGAFESKTCIVLGGGPSLDDCLPWVTENKDKLLIIAVSRISRKLQEVGLVPDIVIALDPQQISYNVSKELYNFPSNVTFLTSYHVIPRLMSQWKGRSAYLGNRVPWDSKLNPEPHFTEGPTVVNAALIAAVDMGCAEVLLAGVDMCYGTDGSTHASGSFESEREIDISRESQWLETYAGHKAETIIPLILTANYLSKHAKYAKDKGVNVYNLSKNALKLDFVEYKHTSEFDLANFEFSPKETIGCLIPSVSTNDIRRDLNQLNSEFIKVSKDLNVIDSLAKEAIDATNIAYLENTSEKQSIVHRKKIEKVERKIKQSFGYLDKLLKTLAFKDFAKILIGGSASSLSNQDLAQRNINYYQAYVNGVKQLKTLLNPARERIEVAIHAYKKPMNVELVTDYFCQHDEYRVAEVLLLKRDRELSPDERNGLVAMKEQHQEYDQSIVDAYAQLKHGLEGVDNKIRELAKNKDREGLTAVIEFLSRSKEDPIKVKNLKNLALAHGAFWDSKYSQAAELFECADESVLSQWDREQFVDVLVACEQYEKAMQLLNSLVTNNLGLNRLYGQLLAHHGLKDEAVDAYSTYLEVFKQDIDGWLELGSILIDIAAFESALMAFQFVLSLDSEHRIATEMVQKLEQHVGSEATK